MHNYFTYPVCTEGAMTLVNQSSTFANSLQVVSGVVLVCVNQQYVYICADNWDNREADAFGVQKLWILLPSILWYCSSLSIMCFPYLNWPSHRIHSFDIICDSYWCSNLSLFYMCNGTESHFRRCQLPRSDSNSTCPSIGTVNCIEGMCVSLNMIAYTPLCTLILFLSL